MTRLEAIRTPEGDGSILNHDDIRVGGFVVYNDEREGFKPSRGKILEVDDMGIVVQFEDRASTNRIQFVDRAWCDHLSYGFPEQYLYVTECSTGEDWIVEIGDDEPLDLEVLVDRWIENTYGGELVRDGKMTPRIEGKFFAEIKTDGRKPDNVTCWCSGGFYVKGADEN